MIVEDIKKYIDDLDYAMRSVRICLDDAEALVDMHDIVFWATRVKQLREQIKEQL